MDELGRLGVAARAGRRRAGASPRPRRASATTVANSPSAAAPAGGGPSSCRSRARGRRVTSAPGALEVLAQPRGRPRSRRARASGPACAACSGSASSVRSSASSAPDGLGVEQKAADLERAVRRAGRLGHRRARERVAGVDLGGVEARERAQLAQQRSPARRDRPEHEVVDRRARRPSPGRRPGRRGRSRSPPRAGSRSTSRSQAAAAATARRPRLEPAGVVAGQPPLSPVAGRSMRSVGVARSAASACAQASRLR